MALSRLFVFAFASIALTGCTQKEKVVDVETPIGNVEVLEDKSNGNVEVSVDAPGESAPQ